jgi:hypothetical protein
MFVLNRERLPDDTLIRFIQRAFSLPDSITESRHCPYGNHPNLKHEKRHQSRFSGHQMKQGLHISAGDNV